MKKTARLLLFTILCAWNIKATAQVLIKDSTIAIVPYYQKNDTMVYQKQHIVAQIHGTDTTYTSDTVEEFMIVCTKADDKKGYRLEQTFLNGEDQLENDKTEMKQKITNAVTQGMIGMKTIFSIGNTGENLAFENASKTSKELQRRVQTVCDSLEAIIPLVGPVMKEVMSGYAKMMTDNQTSLMANYDEMIQMFEYHGKAFEFEKKHEVILEKDAITTRPGTLQLIALDVPEEEQPAQDWDDYMLVVDGTTYQDAVAAALENTRKTTGKDMTAEQLKLLMGDDMPSGEIECNEYYENEYFGDGWPKELYYRKSSTQGDTTQIEVKHITWLTRSVGNE